MVPTRPAHSKSKDSGMRFVDENLLSCGCDEDNLQGERRRRREVKVNNDSKEMEGEINDNEDVMSESDDVDGNEEAEADVDREEEVAKGFGYIDENGNVIYNYG